MKKKDRKYNFLGVDVTALTYEDLFEYVDAWINDKKSRSHHIALINSYCASLALKNRRLSEIYSKADLVVPDGMPFVYWLRKSLKCPCDQFDASSILIQLAKRSKTKGYTFFLFGGHPEVAQKMRENLKKLFPHIMVVGCISPPFRPLTEEEDQAIIDTINKVKPDILCIGLGTPKQDYWIDQHIYQIQGSVFLPCGAIFDFFGGRIRRAPEFIRQMCLEWLYRLFSKDFKRLLYRYTVANIVFVWCFFLQVAGLREIKPVNMPRD